MPPFKECEHTIRQLLPMQTKPVRPKGGWQPGIGSGSRRRESTGTGASLKYQPEKAQSPRTRKEARTMNPIQELIINFQELAAQIPEAIRPFIVMLAGAIPFIEGEVAAIIGLVGGLNPIVAGIAAAAGNFLCVLAVVLVTSRARTAVVNHNRDRAEATRNATLVPAAPGYQGATAVEAPASAKPQSKGRQRFAKWLVRFGVPGASILGPRDSDPVHLRDPHRERNPARLGPALAGGGDRSLDDRFHRVSLGGPHFRRRCLGPARGWPARVQGTPAVRAAPPIRPRCPGDRAPGK